MANGSDEDIWREFHRYEREMYNQLTALRSDIARVAAQNDKLSTLLQAHIAEDKRRWDEQRARQSQIPTWVYLGIMVALTFLWRVVDWIVADAQLVP